MKWYENDVEAAVTKRLQCKYEPKAVFYGSSTFTLWDTLYLDFEKYAPVNLGFGGSTLAACVWFFDKIVGPLQNPETFILYAGDNDLGDGRQPEEVCIFYRQFVLKLREHFSTVPLYFVSVKPSISRANIMDEIMRTNALIKEETEKKDGEYFINIFDKMLDNKGHLIRKYFKPDGLHLSEKGYEVWKETILNECLNKDD
jgi:lysophospholipase L1-like esterase